MNRPGWILLWIFALPCCLAIGVASGGEEGKAGKRVDFDALVESMVRKTDPSAGGYDTRPFGGNPRRVRTELCKHGKRALPALKRGLVHYFPIIRLTCLEALVKLEAGLPVMKPALKDPDPEIRYEAAKKFIEGQKKEGIDALVSCFRLTQNRHLWETCHKRLETISGIRQRHDWTGISAGEAAKVIEGWERWWKKVRARYRFPQEARLVIDLISEELEAILEECDTEELERIEKEVGQGGDPKKLAARLQKFLTEGKNLDCEVLVRAARCFLRVKEYRKALDLCLRVTDERNREKGISYNIYYDMAHFAAGESHLGLGKEANARESFKRALQLNPDDPRFRKALDGASVKIAK